MVKTIDSWVSCTGTKDDSAGVAAAFAAARNNAFTLVVDCPVLIHSGLDIARVIYIDNGTSVEFTAAGKFIVDNVMHPAFVIANSTNVTLTNWNVEYNASLPVNPDVGGYYQNGAWSAKAGTNQPSGTWNDLELTPWLAANRGIVFENMHSMWSGATNACAVFFVTGDTSNVTFSGLNVSVPTTAGADHFVPVVFQFSVNFKSNVTATEATAGSSTYTAAPHDLTFSNITFDGTLMGWVGNVQDSIFEHVTSNRYSDLQDASGGNVGGVGKWFAPPHLFYLNYRTDEDAALFNSNLTIQDVEDNGVRLGTARDTDPLGILSGYALSLKIGCNTCTVDTYTSKRPDGFLDVLQSSDLTVSNVSASYDSSFIHNIYPAWRFPQGPYSNITFENITLTDEAPTTVQLPAGNAISSTNQNIVYKGVHIMVGRWAGAQQYPFPIIGGAGVNAALDATMSAQNIKVSSTQVGSETLQLKGANTVKVGSSVAISWRSTAAGSCSASGSWGGTMHTEGTINVKFLSAGSYSYNMSCKNPSVTVNAAMPIVAN